MTIVDPTVTSRDSYTRSQPLSPKQVRTINRSTEATVTEKTTKIVKTSVRSLPKGSRNEGADFTLATATVFVSTVGGIGCCTPLAPLSGGLLGAWFGLMALTEGGRRMAYNVPEMIRSGEYQAFKHEMITIHRNQAIRNMIDEDDVLKYFKCPITRDLPIFPVNLMPCHDPRYHGRATYDYEAIMKLVQAGRTAPIYRDEPRLGGKVYYDFYHANTTIVRLAVIISKIDVRLRDQSNPDPRIRIPHPLSTTESDVRKKGDIHHVKTGLTGKKDKIQKGYRQALINPIFTPDSGSVYDQFPSVPRPTQAEIESRAEEFEKEMPQVFSQDESERKLTKSEFSDAVERDLIKFTGDMYCKRIIPVVEDCTDLCCSSIFTRATNTRPKITCTADRASAADVSLLQREIQQIYLVSNQVDEEEEKEYVQISVEHEHKYEYERVSTTETVEMTTLNEPRKKKDEENLDLHDE